MIEKHVAPSAAADLLSCNTETVLRMIRRGDLRAVRIGSSLRIPESALEEMVSMNTVSVRRNVKLLATQNRRR